MMENGKQHHMVIARTYPTGAEEWYCPTCGRRFIMQWPPSYKRILLETGDEAVQHDGSKGEMGMGLDMGTQSVENKDETPGYDENEMLDPWLEYLNEIDLDTRLDDEEDKQG